MVTGGTLFDHAYDSVEEDNNILEFERGIIDKQLSIDITGTSRKNLNTAIDLLEEVTEKDIQLMKPGRLYVGESYLKCWLIGSEKSRWISDLESIGNKLTIRTDYPYWITEKRFSYRKSSGEVAGSEHLEYPHDFPYDYARGTNTGRLYNEHYTDSGFKMIIYGPCINPIIRISEHVYEVKTTINEGEYVIIDSSSRYAKDRKIVKIKVDGTEEDIFNSRNKDSDIWKKIPPGEHTVLTDGNFGFEIILLNERSGPKWTLS